MVNGNLYNEKNMLVQKTENVYIRNKKFSNVQRKS